MTSTAKEPVGDGTDVLVRRGGGPGLSAEDLYDEVRRRLPSRRVHLATTPEVERTLISEATVLVGNSLDTKLLDRAENLRLYAHVSTGVNALPLDELAEREVAVTNASGLMPSIAEQVVGYILLFARDFLTGLNRQRRREWRHYQPGELNGSTVTVVGLGAIGTQILDRLAPFDVERLGVRHSPEKAGPADEIFDYDDLHVALCRTDYLVLACPLTEQTRGLIGSEEFATLPTRAVLVNVARGPVVETDALVAALQRNGIAGAALDVTEPEPLPTNHPLWRFGNVVITPHNAGNTSAHWERVADLLAENLERVDRTGEYVGLRNQVVEP